jgi:glutamate dehydrogenase (NAD(P)+)
VICAAVEYHGGTEASAFVAIEEKIATNTREVLEQAAAGKIEPRRAALKLAEQRIADAAGYRRWH